MRPTRTRLVAGAVALACLAGPAAALADRPDDGQPPGWERSEQDDRSGQDRGQGDGGTPAPPEPLVPAPPAIEAPEAEPEPRERRRPRTRDDGGRPAPRPAPGAEAAEPPQPEPPPAGQATDARPPREEAPARRRPAREECDRKLRRGETLVTIDDLCEGRAAVEQHGQRASATTAGGAVGGVVLVGALALLSAAGLRILALRSR